MLDNIDVWFYALVSAAVVLRLLLSSEPNPGLRGAFASTLAAFIVAKIGTEPILDQIPTDDATKYRDAVVVALALLGNEIVAGTLSAGKNPKEAISFLISFVFKRRPPQ